MRIGLTFTPLGLESVTVLANNPTDRRLGSQLCAYLEDEINEFEKRILEKLDKVDFDNWREYGDGQQ